MFLGIDIGSASSKAAVISDDRKLVSTAVINLGTGSGAAQHVIDEALKKAGVLPDRVKYSVVTGYGRMTFQGANEQMTEITCHAKGVSFMMPSVQTVIDIGGQDAKVIRLSDAGTVTNFVMNEKCAAGTGRFLEVMARILGCGIEKLSDCAEKSREIVTISSTCTVFAESEVISQLASGKKQEDVARGAHISVAQRVTGLANRIGVMDDVGMTGGVALNRNLVRAMEYELGRKIKTVPEAQSMGAIGAALYAFEKYTKKNRKESHRTRI